MMSLSCGGSSPARFQSPGGGSIQIVTVRPVRSLTASVANVPNAPTKLEVGSATSCSRIVPSRSDEATSALNIRTARSENRAGSTYRPFLARYTGTNTNRVTASATATRIGADVGLASSANIPSSIAAQATHTPTDGNTTYRLERTGRKTVRLCAPTTQTAPAAM